MTKEGRPVPAAASLIRVDPPCRQNPDLFFSTAPARVEKAKAICARCPLRRPCLLTSLEWDEQFGTWGAHTAQERQQLLNPDHPNPTSCARGVA